MPFRESGCAVGGVYRILERESEKLIAYGLYPTAFKRITLIFNSH